MSNNKRQQSFSTVTTRSKTAKTSSDCGIVCIEKSGSTSSSSSSSSPPLSSASSSPTSPCCVYLRGTELSHLAELSKPLTQVIFELIIEQLCQVISYLYYFAFVACCSQGKVNKASRLSLLIYRDVARRQIVRGRSYSMSTRVLTNGVMMRRIVELLSEKVSTREIV